MKKLFGFILILITLSIYSCDSRNDEYVTPPDPYPYWERTITVNGDLTVGNNITMTVSHPNGFNHIIWEITLNNKTTPDYGETITYKPKEKGTIKVRVKMDNENGTKLTAYKEITIR